MILLKIVTVLVEMLLLKEYCGGKFVMSHKRSMIHLSSFALQARGVLCGLSIFPDIQQHVM